MEKEDSPPEGGSSPGFYQEGPETSEPESSLRDNGSEIGAAHDAVTSEDTYGLNEDSEEEGDDTGGGLLDDEEASESASEDEQGMDGSDDDDDGDDEDDEDEDDRNNFNSLLDISAIEGSDTDSSSDEDEDMNDKHHVLSTRTFHSFTLLPTELRERVWEFYNPYLRPPQHPTGGGRILTCVISDGWQPRIIETQVLSTIMARTNAMLAVHRETRDLALKHFPHTLKSGTEFGLIRFHRDRDILFFSFPGQPVPLHRFDIGLLYESVGEFRHLAIDCGAVSPLGEWLASPAARQLTQRLDTLYLNYEAMDIPSRDLRWCFSLPTRTFCVDTEEESSGIGEDSEYTYVWADQAHPEFSKEQMIQECAGLYGGGGSNRSDRGDGGHEEGEDDEGGTEPGEQSPFALEHLAGCTILPMAEFAFAGGTARFAKLEERFRKGAWEAGDEFSSDEERSESELDEYESEGIDDDTIDEDGEGDQDDEDDLVVRDDLDSDDEDGSRPPSLDGGSGRSPIEIEDDTMDIGGGDGDEGGVIARFSSDEEGSPPRRRRGGTVTYSDDSDSDSDDEDEIPVQRAKRGKRARIVDSDSEDGGGADVSEERPRKMARRVPIIVSDDEDEEDDSDIQEVPAPSRKRRRPTAAASSEEDEDSAASESGSGSGSDDEESGEENEDEDARPAKPQTLAERLRLFRDDNPVPEGEENVSQSGSGGDEQYHKRYSDDDDDETGFEGFEEDDMGDSRGHSMGMDTFDAGSDLDDEDEEDGY